MPARLYYSQEYQSWIFEAPDGYLLAATPYGGGTADPWTYGTWYGQEMGWMDSGQAAMADLAGESSGSSAQPSSGTTSGSSSETTSSSGGAAGTLTVSNAGTAAYDGDYAWDGSETYNGENVYRKAGSTHVIYLSTMTGGWCIYDCATSLDDMYPFVAYTLASGGPEGTYTASSASGTATVAFAGAAPSSGDSGSSGGSGGAIAFTVAGDNMADTVVIGTTAYKGGYYDSGQATTVLGDAYPVYTNGNGYYVYCYSNTAIPTWTIGAAQPDASPQWGGMGDLGGGYANPTMPAMGTYSIGPGSITLSAA